MEDDLSVRYSLQFLNLLVDKGQGPTVRLALRGGRTPTYGIDRPIRYVPIPQRESRPGSLQRFRTQLAFGLSVGAWPDTDQRTLKGRIEEVMLWRALSSYQ
jgi:hypothetical protein